MLSVFPHAAVSYARVYCAERLRPASSNETLLFGWSERCGEYADQIDNLNIFSWPGRGTIFCKDQSNVGDQLQNV